jgi:hypothetical protein
VFLIGGGVQLAEGLAGGWGIVRKQQPQPVEYNMQASNKTYTFRTRELGRFVVVAEVTVHADGSATYEDGVTVQTGITAKDAFSRAKHRKAQMQSRY